jgi:hypothetical protein
MVDINNNSNKVWWNEKPGKIEKIVQNIDNNKITDEESNIYQDYNVNLVNMRCLVFFLDYEVNLI